MSISPSQDAATSLTLGPQLPYTMGRFTLCKELGAGGMATVYLSKMKLGGGLDRLVAVKTIHSHLAKERTFVDMFLDEAKIASHISHPNVCSVYDFGDVRGIYYIAMEYLIGEPLIDFVNAIAASEDETLLQAVPFLAARIIADACEGLHAAHTLRGNDGKRLEVVHRDVSPQNLFVTYEGSVKVVDFGCAKALERVTQTNTGIMKGKVSYAAPEQLNGERMDARVDVFALGVCLWEALAMRQLFRRDNAIKTAMAVLEEPIPMANEGCPWVPQELADIANKALARDPAKRYASARALGKALRGFIARSGAPFEAAEVAEWMGHLFHDRHRQMLTDVAEVEAIELANSNEFSQLAPAPLSEDISSEPSGGGIGNAKTKLAKSVSKQQSNVWDQHADDEPIVLPTRTGRYVAMVLLFLLALAGGGYGYYRYDPTVLARLGIEVPSQFGAIANEPLGDPPLDPLVDPVVVEGTEGEVSPPPIDPANAEGTSPEVERIDPEIPVDPTIIEGNPTNRPRDRRNPANPEGAVVATPPGEVTPEENTSNRRLDFSQGSVYVRTVGGGWATVFHDGRELGRTPLRIQLPVGQQTLRVLPLGHEPAQTHTVTIEWGAMPTVDVRVPAADAPGNAQNPYN